MAIDAAVELLNAVLDEYPDDYPDEDFYDYGPSPRVLLTAEPMDQPMDVDNVVGVVPDGHRREGRFEALQQGSDRPAEVYGLSREQTEDTDMDSTSDNLY